MQLQRRYNLPNCTLVLEGLPDASGTGLEASQRLGILLNAECYLAGHEPHLSGGKDFFTDLVTTVSRYAQFCLSGISQPPTTESSSVRLAPKGNDRHQLEVTLAPEVDTASDIVHVRTVDLTTVQLFDLVEAIDQFFADPLALPDFTLALRPTARGTTAPTEPLAQRALAPTLGIATVAVAGFFFVNLPTPRVNVPGELLPEGETAQVVGEPDTSGAGAGADPDPEPETDAIDSSPTNPGEGGTIAGETDGAEPVPPDSSSTAQERDLEALEAAAAAALDGALEQAPTIGDREQLSQMAATLFNRVNGAWTEQPTFTEELIYRAGVSADGKIVGYRHENFAARAYVEETPLLDLLDLPRLGAAATPNPMAEFRLVFTPTGRLEVSPWHGYPPEDETLPRTQASPSASPRPSAQATPRPNSDGPGQPIASRPQLETLTQDLYQQIDQAWDISSPSFVDRLTFQVTINNQGEILDYEPVTAGAGRFGAELPLADLKQADADNGAFGIFRVVFTPSGVLEVSPWDGLE